MVTAAEVQQALDAADAASRAADESIAASKARRAVPAGVAVSDQPKVSVARPEASAAGLTIGEARRMALAAHPGWRSDDIDNLARGILAKAERLAALDQLNETVERLQTEADAKNAADYDPDSPLGRLGGSASVWDAFDDAREAELWDQAQDSAARDARRQAEQTARHVGRSD